MGRSLKTAAALAVGILASTAAIGLGTAFAETPQVLARAAAGENVVFELYFPLRNADELHHLIDEQVRPGSPLYRKWLTPQQFETRFGPTQATIGKVTAELAAYGLSVTERLAHGIRVSGSAASVERLYGVELNHGRFATGHEALVADRALTPTPALAASGARTAAFSTVGPKHKHSHVVPVQPQNYKSEVGPYFTADLRQAYDFPGDGLNGQGVTIGILMEGNYLASDIMGYFTEEEVNTAALRPKLTSIPINGGKAWDANNSIETHLDIEQSSGIALGANEVLYDLSDLSNPTVLYGLDRIVSDNVVDVVNMSFGEPEVDYLPAANNGVDQRYQLTIEDDLFAQGSAQGITFVASSGDHGGDPKGGASQVPTKSVEEPASDPYVTGVGGTNLLTTFDGTTTKSLYVSENASPDAEKGGGVWASGGGISIIWQKPSYQNLVTTPSTAFRTVPDLALHMGGCPSDAAAKCVANTRSSDWVAINGGLQGVIGTSASAPDIAGMWALMVQHEASRLGPMNTFIYTRAKTQDAGGAVSFHHTGIAGFNGVYHVGGKYDPVIGNGTLDVRVFLGLTGPASGNPGTGNNP